MMLKPAVVKIVGFGGVLLTLLACNGKELNRWRNSPVVVDVDVQRYSAIG